MRVTFESFPRDHAAACRALEALCEGIVLAMMEEIDGFPTEAFPCCIKCGGFRTKNGSLAPAQVEAITFTLEHGHPRAQDRGALEEVLTEHGYALGDDYDAQAEAEVAQAEVASPNGGDQLRARNYEFGYDVCTPGARPEYDYDRCQSGLACNQRPPHQAAHLLIRSATQILRSKDGTTIELACYQCAQKRRHADEGARVEIVCTIPGTFRAIVRCSAMHEKPEKRGAIDDPVVDARPVGGCGCAIDQPLWEDDAPEG